MTPGWNCAENASPAEGPGVQDLRVERAWPEIAVLMPVWESGTRFWCAALDLHHLQSYGHWQLCLADDALHQTGRSAELLRLRRRAGTNVSGWSSGNGTGISRGR